MPMNTSGFISQCTPSPERMRRRSYCPLAPPTGPPVALKSAAGLLLNGCGWNRDIQSIAFLSGAPTDQLYSGEAKSSARSEEHTSELQSLAYLVCRLLLEKKKKTDKFD